MARTPPIAPTPAEALKQPDAQLSIPPEPNLLSTFSKKTRLVALLRQTDGAALTTISNELGWLPHTTRAAITGLRKAGYLINTSSGEAGTRYNIAGEPPVMANAKKGE